MRVLLDTNILIHRERAKVVRDDIGVLFQWLDRLGAQKCIHRGSVQELEKHADAAVVHTMKVKVQSYHLLKTRAPDSSTITKLRARDLTPNDHVDTDLIAEVAAGRVDILVTEDRGIHSKAAAVGISSSVFTIDSFLEKATAENPDLADYKVLSVKKAHFGEVGLSDPFFDSFRRDYPGFDAWYNRKADETAYVCTNEVGGVVAFLYLKREGKAENYSDIMPPLKPATRLKIGTFKVTANGFKLGERFLKIAFDNALRYGVEEIYVTAFRSSPDHDRLIQLLEEWGFMLHGTKDTPKGPEEVYVRDFRPSVDIVDPRRSFPYVSGNTRQFIVSIWPSYHTELLPDSILTTESAQDFIEQKPNRNAVSKVFISRSLERGLRPGDLVVFYRTASGGPAHYTSVATSLAVVHEVITDIADKETFIQVCRKRSVFSDSELEEHWDYRPSSRPFVVNFLHVHTFPKRPNLSLLKAEGVISEAPRGFDRLAPEAFRRLLEISNADQRIIVH